MKKLIGLTAIMVLSLSVAAFAWGHGGEHGYGSGYNGDSWNYSPTVTSESAAEKIVQDFINNSKLQGYKITSSRAYAAGNGMDMYIVNTTNSAGNAMIFNVSPYGQVNGPMPSY